MGSWRMNSPSQGGLLPYHGRPRSATYPRIDHRVFNRRNRVRTIGSLAVRQRRRSRPIKVSIVRPEIGLLVAERHLLVDVARKRAVQLAIEGFGDAGGGGRWHRVAKEAGMLIVIVAGGGRGARRR